MKIHNHFIDKLAFLNSFLSAIALLPQFYVVAYKGENNVSISSFLIILFNNFIWFVYGLHTKSSPLIVSAFFNAIISFLIIIFSLL